MRITVTRTGGFGGLTRRASVDTASRAGAEDLVPLAEQALADGHRAERPTGVPDGFHYEIEADGEVAYCADPRLSEAQRSLIVRVLQEGA
ncbi:protealysin inhibitor emfourin [Streptomyces sp. TR06-5]|uniref:protealysin inhibitor emfourin n=1 Tax=unclassified Streptomyces TaxID=2593676 RepID=UPI0039A2056F